MQKEKTTVTAAGSYCQSVFLCFYLVDKVLVPGVVCGDDRENVPVILLHNVQHDGRLLLDGGAKLEEHGVVILETREMGPISKEGHKTHLGKEQKDLGHG